ncbi:hypothetical protein B0T14DRAFT_193393 [Immersiella caudata]|uniref:Uncharacterized protein n=1 Tax=Immersiella caudata TaxID=314043 RepID=A0AA39WYT5_9PEZI|nr:hypothetical protein B0T14DRAFT_193393 [Immersiella caudata]
MPALRQTLTKPFVVEPTMDHTHTVVFLHRFPETTTAAIIPSKVLSSRRTKNHKTLTKQFPSVRWVFPYAKTGPRPYADFTADDKDAVGLADANTRSPYITQILLQEAKRVGGLDKVVLGGQGETAIAAHESMACFPEITTAMRDEESAVEEFMKGTFYAPKWTDPAAHPKLAGFVGMHKDDGEVTRDAALRGVAAKARNDPVKFRRRLGMEGGSMSLPSS